MKKLIACIGLAGLATVGCSTSDDYYGASDDARFSTPSWGTSSGLDNANRPGSMGAGERIEDMTPSTPETIPSDVDTDDTLQ